MQAEAPVGTVAARAYTVPTDAPEADGTFSWNDTTIVVVTVEGGGRTGLGYTYSGAAAAAWPPARWPARWTGRTPSTCRAATG